MIKKITLIIFLILLFTSFINCDPNPRKEEKTPNFIESVQKLFDSNSDFFIEMSVNKLELPLVLTEGEKKMLLEWKQEQHSNKSELPLVLTEGEKKMLLEWKQK